MIKCSITRGPSIEWCHRLSLNSSYRSRGVNRNVQLIVQSSALLPVDPFHCFMYLVNKHEPHLVIISLYYIFPASVDKVTCIIGTLIVSSITYMVLSILKLHILISVNICEYSKSNSVYDFKQC